MRWFLGILVTLIVVILCAGGYGYTQIRQLNVEQVTDRLWVLTGIGGNVTVLKTGAGAVLVDSMTFATQGARISALARELTGEPVVMVINSHFHIDHSHGNPGFDPAIDVVATPKTLQHMRNSDPIPGYWEGDAAELLPNKLVERTEEITVGDQRIQLIHPGRGHTDGDLIVLLPQQETVVLGDLLFHRRYPNIDLEHGGSIAAWSQTLDHILALPFRRVVPGHGKVTDADGIRQFQRFLDQLIAVSEKVRAESWSREQAIMSGTLTEDAGYETISVPLLFTLDRQFVLGRAWDEAHGVGAGNLSSTQ